jgi:lysozyme
MNPRTLSGAIAAVLMAAAVAAGFEGERLTPYKDVTGVPTVCMGHTGDVEMRQYHHDECVALLQRDMSEANSIVRRCVGREMPLNVEAAITDFVFNVGAGRARNGADKGKDGFCVLKNGQPSTMRVRASAGDWAGVCQQFQFWTTAGGVEYRGLVRRREADRALCEQRP